MKVERCAVRMGPGHRVLGSGRARGSGLGLLAWVWIASVSGVGCDDEPLESPAGVLEPDVGPETVDGMRPEGGCLPDRAECGDECPDLSSSVEHCGACDNACEPDQSCVGGDCLSPCGEGLSICEGRCVFLETDGLHCGECGNACELGQLCRRGVCELNCSLDRADCDGRCVDVLTDEDHCGKCEQPCEEGAECLEGVCRACEASLAFCEGGCVDVETDELHCGDCGLACDGGRVCVGADCVLDCVGGTSPCGDVCVDVQTDELHCGECGVSCAEDEACVSGDCEDVCAQGLILCEGQCVDTEANPQHCGACGDECAQGQVCVEGQCQCQQSQVLCGGACVDTQTDPANCGLCDHLCASGRACHEGECVCGPGTTQCGLSCVDTDTSGEHCGDCNVGCDSGLSCVQGDCVAELVCAVGFEAPQSCDFFPLDRQACGVPTITQTQVEVGTAPPDVDTTFEVPDLAPNERLRFFGEISAPGRCCGGASVLMSIRNRDASDIVFFSEVAPSNDTALFDLSATGSVHACAVPTEARFRPRLESFDYDVVLERSTLSGKYNTGGIDALEATPLVQERGEGGVCDHVCGDVKAFCDDREAYYEVTIPPRSVAGFEFATTSHHPNGINFDVRALRQGGQFLCDIVDNQIAREGRVEHYLRRIINQSSSPRTVVIAPALTGVFGDFIWNMSVALRPL